MLSENQSHKQVHPFTPDSEHCGGQTGGRFWGALCGQYPVLCTVPQRRIPGKFLLMENGRLEPRPRDGMPIRGDSNTHTSETPRSRAHIKAEISRLENIFGCLGELVNSLGSHCYLTPLLMRPLLIGVEMAGFTHRRPGFEIKIFQIFYFPQNFTLYLLFYPVFSLQKPCSARLQYPDFTPIPAAVPAFTGYFSLKIFLGHRSSRSYWVLFDQISVGSSSGS